MNYDYLHQYIHVGVENAIHQKTLAIRLKTTPDNVKRIIRRARQQGYEILSGSEGYWFASDENEKQDFVRMMQKQAFSRLKTASPINESLRQIKGQMSLTDVISSMSEEMAKHEQN